MNTHVDPQVADIGELIEDRYTANYLGMQPIQISGPAGSKFEILKAYLGWNSGHYFGKILAILRYDGTRYFKTIFHVWSPHQAPCIANHMTDIKEFVVRDHLGNFYLESVDPDFGKKAFWLYTPDSELDPESLELRTVAKELKAFSVKNQLCKKFRKTYIKKEKL